MANTKPLYDSSSRVAFISILLLILIPARFSEEMETIYKSDSLILSVSHQRDELDLQKQKGTIYLTRIGQEPTLIHSYEGFELEDSQRCEIDGGVLILMSWRSSGRGRYLRLDLFWVKPENSSVKKISVPGLPSAIYAGEASLDGSVGSALLEVRVALVGHFFSEPYLYKLHRYTWEDEQLQALPLKYSRPKDATQYLNLGRNFLEQKQYRRAVYFYAEGLRLQRKNPGYIDDPILADIHIDLAKAYVGTGEVRKARWILKLLIESYQALSQTRRAKRILKKLPSEKK
jgi:hypothetical protein